MPTPDQRRRSRQGWGTVAAPMAQFLLAGAAALVIVILALSVASKRIGEREAIVDARSETLQKAQNLVQPVLSDGLMTGDPKAIAALDEVVRNQVKSPTLARVKVWSPGGTILYSDEARLIGENFDLGDDELETLREGLVQAEVSDLTRPENRYEKPERKLLEVYLPVELPSGDRILFETYYDYGRVNASGDRVWRSFAPISIGSLILLELILLPLAWSLAHRLRVRQLEREDLLERAISASEHERRRIAQDLHDGVVQDLAGVSFSLAAVGRAPDVTHVEEIDSAADTVRASIASLRTLLVELYPPNLADEGLGPALADLLARVRAVGIEATADTSQMAGDLPLAAARLIYRTVQEALRNVITHANATSVHIVVASDGSTAWAEVVDDGAGFDVDAARSRPSEGHFGLLGTSDLVRDAGGTLELTSTPGAGTTVRIEVPIS